MKQQFIDSFRNDNPKTKKSKKKSKRYSDKKRLDLKSNLFSSNDELRRLQSLLLHDENNIELWKEFITKQVEYNLHFHLFM